MRNALIAAMALLGSASEARAQGGETWTCAAAAYYGGGMVVRYVRDGADLVDERFGVRYRIVQDTPEGLIAVWSVAEGAADPERPGVMSAVILIDKRTGAFTRSNANAPNHDSDHPVSGACIRG